ncbi:hypothetical protein MMC30_008001 [Trapelia coarctata]|nr:hypothetical protein [Trapelia coarctata]
MKFSHVLPLAALTTAFVIPDEQVMSQVAIESHSTSNSIFDKVPSKETLVKEFENSFSGLLDNAKNAFDHAIESIVDTVDAAAEKLEDASYFDTKAWLDTASNLFNDEEDDGGHHGHKKHPHKKHPHKGHHGHHGHHDHKPNKTVYQLIAESKYTTKLASLINEYDDLVELLNGTTANFTVFAPTDKAFEKIPDHAPKPPKEFLKKVLTYHVSADFYPAGRILAVSTIPTLYIEDKLGKGEAQRLATNIGLRGLTINFYSRVVAVNIFGTNGVIHGVDSIIIPPPKAATIIGLLPGEFSTLELALMKTGLLGAINNTDNHAGGTLFAPSNYAFQRLGPKVNAFLFSKYGQKYLKALLEYHVVANHTLYSDAYYHPKSAEIENFPKGLFHVDLPTLLEGHSLSIDVARYGRFIEIKINGFSRVAIRDGVAKDGVIHVVGNVLIPPKKVGGVMQQWKGEELSEEDLTERLEPFVENPEL